MNIPKSFVPYCRGWREREGEGRGGKGRGSRIKCTNRKIFKISKNGWGSFLGHSLIIIK